MPHSPFRSTSRLGIIAGVFLWLTLSLSNSALAGDWPMWRYDAKRGASTPDALPADLQLHWSIRLPDAMTAWPPEQTKLQFDLQAHPVAAGQRLFVPSSKNDSVTAFDTRTGKELWRFTADGPVRFAPVAYAGKVYFVSDDGNLYALNQEDGALLWKKRGGPSGRPILGNDRLISSWPARGGPVIHGGKLYFTASIWPFMGIFVHALDPETGKTIWTNSGIGSQFTVQPHSAPSFATLAPQGHLTASGDYLVVPGGRSVPGVFDAASGKLLHFEYDKKLGGHEIGTAGDTYYCAGHAYRLSDGKTLSGGAPAFVDDTYQFAADRSSILARTLEPNIDTKTVKDRRGKESTVEEWTFPVSFRIPLAEAAPGSWFVKAGDRLFAGGAGKIAAYDLPKNPEKTKPAALLASWKTDIEGTPWSMLAADDRLFVVTLEGELMCFSSGEPDEEKEKGAGKPVRNLPAPAGGYAVTFGNPESFLNDPLLSDKHTIFVAPEEASSEKARRMMQDAGTYGITGSVRTGSAITVQMPPYFADVILFEKTPGADEIAAAHQSLRPYGGKMVFEDGGKETITREGSIPGADDWTHQYGGATQTVVSRDDNVKAPFGVLWFGGPSHEGILPRHGHGPSPQVAGGRLFIEGVDKLRAVDVYTGRLLWEKDLPGFGDYYNRTDHFAGAGEIGTNYVSLPDAIYAVYGPHILELDAKTGRTLRAFPSPKNDEGESTSWGFCLVSGDYLIAAAEPLGAVEAKVKSGGTVKKIADALGDVAAKGAANATAVIPQGAEWNYLAGSDPDKPTWKDQGFELDANWKSGKAGFGYGDGDDATEFGTMRNKFGRVYIRKNLDRATVPEDTTELSLRVLYDDGFVAYLNGSEIARSNVSGSGEKGRPSSHEADRFESFAVRDWKNLLRDGGNVLAVEGHNIDLSSSDFSLHPILDAIVSDKKAEPVPDVVKAPENPVAGSDAIAVEDGGIPGGTLPAARFAPGSKTIVAFRRSTGEFLWQKDAAFNFRHNNLCAAGDRLFALDSLTAARSDALRRRGLKPEGKPRLIAFDLATGEERWFTDENVFGTFLSYSADHDLVIQSGSKARDRASDEIGKGMAAHHASDGSLAWNQPDLNYGGPPMVFADRILTNGTGGFAIDIETGIPTGWTYARHYGCNTAVGSTHLLTFRSGAAGFFDLLGDSGTGNLGGFRSSCTNNLIPAGGVLNAPDYTRTCTCAYQNQASLALIHMPENEFWTFGAKAHRDRLGINFGAPGDRRSPDGTLFVDYPSTGGDSPDPEISIKGSPSYFRHHASVLPGDLNGWLTASGISGEVTIEIKLPAAASAAKTGTVHLYLPPSKAPQSGITVQTKSVPTPMLAVGDKTRIVKLADVDFTSGSVTVQLPDSIPLSAVEFIW